MKITNINPLDIDVEIVNANHVIIRMGGYTILKSYNSVIAVKPPTGKVMLGPNWDYSATTSKHRNKFLGELTADTRKKLASGGYIAL